MEEIQEEKKIKNFNKIPINFQDVIGYCSQSICFIKILIKKKIIIFFFPSTKKW